jgi:hypothetical protein
VGVQVAPFWQIILIPSQPVFALTRNTLCFALLCVDKMYLLCVDKMYLLCVDKMYLLCVDKMYLLLHSDKLSWFLANQSLLLPGILCALRWSSTCQFYCQKFYWRRKPKEFYVYKEFTYGQSKYILSTQSKYILSTQSKSNLYTHRLLSQWTSTIEIQLGVLDQYKADIIIISLKCILFLSWYTTNWKIALSVINNNHSREQ